MKKYSSVPTSSICATSELDHIAREVRKQTSAQYKSEKGQFLTPLKVARFMASLFTSKDNCTLLDAGAGIGSLTAAASEYLKITMAHAWEVDEFLTPYLSDTLTKLGIGFELHQEDFLESMSQQSSWLNNPIFTHAILNPPYKKISSTTKWHHYCKALNINSINLYSAFVGVGIRLLKPGGELVAIIPRSFCNGSYYKTLREEIISSCSIDYIHLFDSRTTTFRDDKVLQENIIIKLTKGKAQGSVMVSQDDDIQTTPHCIPFSHIVRPQDSEKFFRIPQHRPMNDDLLTHVMVHDLKSLNIQVSTGPIIDFRVKSSWLPEMTALACPLIYPHHLHQGAFTYHAQPNKPSSLKPSTDLALLPVGNYVVVKRISPKENQRRINAYVLSEKEQRQLTSTGFIGIDNHLNYFHVNKKGLPLAVANGLCCFLNSTTVDELFRTFSGNTQVNATDLRNIPYPDIISLEKIGQHFISTMSQQEIDILVESLADDDNPDGATNSN